MTRMDRPLAGHPHRPFARPTRWSRRPGGSPVVAPVPRLLARRLPLFVRPAVPPEVAQNATRGCVLIIDDDDFGRQTLGLILQADGFQVRQACSGCEAMSCLSGVPTPGLILIDVCRWWDVRRLLRQLRSEPRLGQIPVIVVSALEPGRAVPAGVVACFEKPIAVEALRAAIREHCR